MLAIALTLCSCAAVGVDTEISEICTIEDQEAGLCQPPPPPPSDFVVNTTTVDLGCGFNVYTEVRLHPWDHITASTSFSIRSSPPVGAPYGYVDGVLGHWISLQSTPSSLNILVDGQLPSAWSPISQCTHGTLTSVYRRASESVELVFVSS